MLRLSMRIPEIGSLALPECRSQACTSIRYVPGLLFMECNFLPGL